MITTHVILQRRGIGKRGPTYHVSTQRGGGSSFGPNVKKPTSWAKKRGGGSMGSGSATVLCWRLMADTKAHASLQGRTFSYDNCTIKKHSE